MSTANDPTNVDSTAAAQGPNVKATLQQLQQTLKELIDYSRYYAELHWDQLKLTIVKYALLAVLAVVVAISMATLLIAGGIVLVIGFSYSLAEWLFEGNGAYGLLLGGALIVVPVIAVVAIGIGVAQSRFRAQLGHKYETKKREQRARYGHDVEQRAATAAA